MYLSPLLLSFLCDEDMENLLFYHCETHLTIMTITYSDWVTELISPIYLHPLDPLLFFCVSTPSHSDHGLCQFPNVWCSLLWRLGFLSYAQVSCSLPCQMCKRGTRWCLSLDSAGSGSISSSLATYAIDAGHTSASAWPGCIISFWVQWTLRC